MSTKPFISIIIPVEKKTTYLEEALYCYSQQTYSSFEVIISSSTSLSPKYSFSRVVVNKKLAGDVASKRNQILRFGKGEIFVFNDDDVFVPPKYLENIVKKLKNSKIFACCGPLLTPSNDSFMQQASGMVWESYLGSLGAGIYRSRQMPSRIVYDYPAANLIIRKKVFQGIGGFEPGLYPGEDTKLCLLIFNKYRRGVLYDPALFVYHHRKPLFREHLRQIGRYGSQRGWFALSYPATSLKLPYFLPSFLLLYLVLWLLLLIKSFILANFSLAFFLSLPLVIFALLVIIESVWLSFRKKSFFLAPLVSLGIVTTHLYYGYQFLLSFWRKILQKIREILKPFLVKKL